MPVGDCERAFAAAAARDGIALERARDSWLNQRGHLGLPDDVAGAAQVLGLVFDALGGRPEEQAAKRRARSAERYEAIRLYQEEKRAARAG